MHPWIVVPLWACLAPPSSPVRSDDRRISREEATELVYKAIDRQPVTRLPGFGLEPLSMPNFPQFYFFEGTWNNSKPGSGVSGHWAVDARTGDVWEPFSCKLLSSPGLRSELARIRREKNILPRDVRRARRDKPCF